jgi:hypothetical protein
VRTVAKPDLKDGYFLIAYELMAAVAAAGFNRGAQIVLCEVFAQIYGLAKRKEAVLSPSDIAHRTKYDRSNLIRSIRELTKANVLVNVGEIRYRFNKDYETWKLNETPEQRSLRLAYSRFAPTLAKSFAYDKLVEDHQQNVKRLMEETPEGCVKSDTGDQSHQQTSCVNSDTPSVSILTHPEHAHPSIVGSEPVARTEIVSTDAENSLSPPLTIPPVGTDKGEIMSATPTGDGGVENGAGSIPESEKTIPDVVPVLRSAGHPGSTAVERLIAWSYDVLGVQAEMESFASCIHACITSRYSLDWIEDAVLTAQANVQKRFASYVNSCLIHRRARGGSPSLSPSVNGSVPHPARKESPQERERRISDGIRKSADRIKALEDEL